MLTAYKARFSKTLSSLGREEEKQAKAAMAVAAASPSTTDAFGPYVAEALTRADAAFVGELEAAVEGYKAAFCVSARAGGGEEEEGACTFLFVYMCVLIVSLAGSQPPLDAPPPPPFLSHTANLHNPTRSRPRPHR